MKKISLLITGIMIYMGLSHTLDAQTLRSHDFNDGKYGPFYECTTQNPNYTRIEDGRMTTFWTESGYNGTRMTKGAEACCEDWHTLKEGWYGMIMHLGSDYPKNKQAGVAQIFQFVNSSFWTWAAMLLIVDGDLEIIHRADGGTSNNVEEVVYADFPYEEDVEIIIHFILSQANAGKIQVWVNGVSKYHVTNTNFGFGSWNGDVQAGGYTYIDLKVGQYNFEDSDYDNNETRTIYYDNLSWYNGADGYSLVDPSGTTGNLSSVSTTTPSINARFRLTGINELEITLVNPLHGDIDISLFSPSGKMLNTYSTNSAAPVRFKVHNSGVYLVTLQSTTGRLIKKNVVQ